VKYLFCDLADKSGDSTPRFLRLLCEDIEQQRAADQERIQKLEARVAELEHSDADDDEDDLFDLLDGFYAAYGGCASSGIRDDALQAVVADQLQNLTQEERVALLKRFYAKYYLEPTYHDEDRGGFHRWFWVELLHLPEPESDHVWREEST
jgi:hypothetical protein